MEGCPARLGPQRVTTLFLCFFLGSKSEKSWKVRVYRVCKLFTICNKNPKPFRIHRALTLSAIAPVAKWRGGKAGIPRKHWAAWTGLVSWPEASLKRLVWCQNKQKRLETWLKPFLEKLSSRRLRAKCERSKLIKVSKIECLCVCMSCICVTCAWESWMPWQCIRAASGWSSTNECSLCGFLTFASIS